MVRFGLSFAAPGVPASHVAVTLGRMVEVHACKFCKLYLLHAHMWVLENTLVCVHACMRVFVCARTCDIDTN